MDENTNVNPEEQKQQEPIMPESAPVETTPAEEAPAEGESAA